MRGKNTLEMNFGDELLIKATEMDHSSLLESVSRFHPFGKEGRLTYLYKPLQPHTWSSGADCFLHPPLDISINALGNGQPRDSSLRLGVI